MREDTTMRVKKATKKRFGSFGFRGETDDELLNRLLDELETARRELERFHKREGDNFKFESNLSR